MIEGLVTLELVLKCTYSIFHQKRCIDIDEEAKLKNIY